MPTGKRVFDVVVALAMLIVLWPILLAAALAILILEGRPVLYVSSRRVHGHRAMRIMKFRTMRRDADRLLNRQTVPVGEVRFLNIAPDSPAYTPVGRLVERVMLTELPQLLHVLGGSMSIVGNRPLPENVIDALRLAHPEVERRFLVPTGLTGPIQLVGRDGISDADRLRVEIGYCQAVADGYSALLDLRILCQTVMICVSPRFRLSPDQAVALVMPRAGLWRRSRPAPAALATLAPPR